jgi:hypothetical protein
LFWGRFPIAQRALSGVEILEAQEAKFLDSLNGHGHNRTFDGVSYFVVSGLNT